MTTYQKVIYRDISKLLASKLPVEGEAFSEAVESNLKAIKAMDSTSKIALKSAYIFSRKVPREEREDVFQELFTILLEKRVNDEKLAYAIARCDWRDWWKKYKVRQHTSLDSVTEDEEGNPATLAEVIIGEVDFERRIDGQIEAETIWHKLEAYPGVKRLVVKRLLGETLKRTENDYLKIWAIKNATRLLLS